MRNLNRARRGARSGRLAVVALTALAALGLMAAIPATSTAAKFGAKLTPDIQPSNSSPPHSCEPTSGQCSRVLNEAYGRPNHGHKAPKSGKIKRIRIIAGSPGKFRFQLFRKKPGSQDRFKAVFTSRKRFSYQGQPDGDEPFKIESFKVNIRVHKNNYMGTRARGASNLRCSSGGDNILFFQPPLIPGDSYLKPDEDDGCWMLMEAVIR